MGGILELISLPRNIMLFYPGFGDFFHVTWLHSLGQPKISAAYENQQANGASCHL